MTLPTAAVVRTTAIKQLGTSTSEDTLIDTLIARADAVLADYCNFPPASASVDPTLEATTYTHYLDGGAPTDGRVLLLPVRPVASVTTIHDDDDRTWDYGAADLVSSDDYTLDGVEGRVYLHSDASHAGWTADTRAIKVVYSAGYDTGADARITQAIAMLVGHWWQSLPMNGFDSTTLTDTTIDALPMEIPNAVKEKLANVKLWEAGIG